MSLDTWTFADDNWNTSEPIGDYVYREGKLSGGGSLGDNPQATRVFLVDWEMLPEFVDSLLGYAEQPTSVGGLLKRTLPEEHPTLSYFYAVDAQYKTIGVGSVSSGGNKSQWPLAEITATYKPLPYAVYDDGDIDSELERFVSVETVTKAEYLTANNVGMQFVTRTENKSVQTSPGILQPSVVNVYTWHRVPAPDTTDNNVLGEFKPPCLERFREMIGKTNYTTFDANPPGTMLLIDVTTERLMPAITDGLYLYNISYSFEVRNYGTPGVGSDEAKGVNYIYDLANDRYDLITTTGSTGGKRLFQTAEFNDLFRWEA